MIMKSVLSEEDKKLVVEVHTILYELYVKMFPEQKGKDFSINLLLSIFEFAEIFQSDNGIKAMSDFIEYATQKGLTWENILATCMHDINGMHDKFMLPRTSSYLVTEKR